MILTIVAMLSMTMTFAENENMMKKLSQALGLSKDQVEGVAEVHKTFSAEMLFAAQYGKEERAKMVEKAIQKDLAYMNYMLSDSQYRKYVMLLNVTLHNRGLK